jgi:hypothetical protein
MRKSEFSGHYLEVSLEATFPTSASRRPPRRRARVRRAGPADRSACRLPAAASVRIRTTAIGNSSVQPLMCRSAEMRPLSARQRAICYARSSGRRCGERALWQFVITNQLVEALFSEAKSRFLPQTPGQITPWKPAFCRERRASLWHWFVALLWPESSDQVSPRVLNDDCMRQGTFRAFDACLPCMLRCTSRCWTWLAEVAPR